MLGIDQCAEDMKSCRGHKKEKERYESSAFSFFPQDSPSNCCFSSSSLFTFGAALRSFFSVSAECESEDWIFPTSFESFSKPSKSPPKKLEISPSCVFSSRLALLLPLFFLHLYSNIFYLTYMFNSLTPLYLGGKESGIFTFLCGKLI